MLCLAGMSLVQERFQRERQKNSMSRMYGIEVAPCQAECFEECAEECDEEGGCEAESQDQALGAADHVVPEVKTKVLMLIEL